MFQNFAAQERGFLNNHNACDAAAQRNQELFRLLFELISLREKVAQAELTSTHSRSFSSAAAGGGKRDLQRTRRKSAE
jgi:hypothetical protein